MYYVYMIKNVFGQIYTGITQNLNKRISYHNNDRGAVFTRGSGDFSLVFLETYETLEQARVREIQIKKWRREKKETLVERFQKGLPTR